MIAQDHITEWRTHAPWPQDLQVEQDLVISRGLVEIFSRPALAEALAFRGGTALYKLHVRPAARYSEDIDSGSGRGRADRPGGRRASDDVVAVARRTAAKIQ